MTWKTWNFAYIDGHHVMGVGGYIHLSFVGFFVWHTQRERETETRMDTEFSLWPGVMLQFILQCYAFMQISIIWCTFHPLLEISSTDKYSAKKCGHCMYVTTISSKDFQDKQSRECKYKVFQTVFLKDRIKWTKLWRGLPFSTCGKHIWIPNMHPFQNVTMFCGWGPPCQCIRGSPCW